MLFGPMETTQLMNLTHSFIAKTSPESYTMHQLFKFFFYK